MPQQDEEQEQLRRAALENAKSIAGARRREQQRLARKTEQVSDSLALMRTILECTTDGIVVCDDADRVTHHNESYARMWRIPAELLAAGDHPRLREFIRAQLRDPKQVDSGGAFDVLELADGRTIERRSQSLSPDKPSLGRLWSYRDVSDRVRAQQEHAYLSSIILSSNDAVVSKTLDGIITSWNATAERIFGYPASEAIGRPMSIVIPPDRLDEEARILERLARGEVVEHFETVRVRKDGRHINVSLTISPVRDPLGRIIGASKIARDVTERDQLLAAERAARARAEDAGRIKDEFLAILSHELRNPLNAVLGWTALLQKTAADPEVQAGLKIIERNAKAQVQLVADLLDMSRIAAGKLRLSIEDVELADVVREAIQTHAHAAAAREIRVDLDAPADAIAVRCDRDRMLQVMSNLLSNAVKFTGSGGRVTVRAWAEGASAIVTVSDTGQGIEPGFMPQLFGRFRQAESSAARKHGGLGLGLALVRQLVELHGGSVSAESPGPGQGSTFRVELPLRERSSDFARPSTALTDLPELEGLRVLVIDDENDARQLVKRVLEESRMEVLTASSADEAFEKLKQHAPDIVLCDIGMPRGDGYQFIMRVRACDDPTPAIAVTGFARVEDRLRALRAGFQAHVAKPLDYAELLTAIASLAIQRRPR